MARHDASDLCEVGQVVRNPRRQVLAKRNHAELGMPAPTVEISGFESERFEVCQAR